MIFQTSLGIANTREVMVCGEGPRCKPFCPLTAGVTTELAPSVFSLCLGTSSILSGATASAWAPE